MFIRKMLVGIPVVIFLICLQIAGTVSAAETPTPFKIAAISVSHGSNFHFRVHSNSPSAWLCHNGPINGSWAYVNEADSGAKVKIATLLNAYNLGKTVSLVTEGVIVGSATYCHILEFSIN